MIYAVDTVFTISIVAVVCVFLGLLIGAIVGYFVRVKQREGTLRKTEEECKNLVENAKKEMVLEAKQEIFSLRKEAEKDIKNRKAEAIEMENKLNQRENQINSRVSNLDRRE